LLSKLGKYKTGVACLYIKKIEDIDLNVLRELVRRSAEQIRRLNPKANPNCSSDFHQTKTQSPKD